MKSSTIAFYLKRLKLTQELAPSADYCVYLTIYNGRRLPTYYIGSSTTTKVKNGYRGSVSSKQYRATFYELLVRCPSRFHTVILSTHDTREKAYKAELHLHNKYNVVDSSDFMNRAPAFPNKYVDIKKKLILLQEECKEANLYLVYKIGKGTLPRPNKPKQRPKRVAAEGFFLSGKAKLSPQEKKEKVRERQKLQMRKRRIDEKLLKSGRL